MRRSVCGYCESTASACVRDCASFGLPEHVRIGVRRIEDCRRLAGALQEVLEKTDG